MIVNFLAPMTVEPHSQKSAVEFLKQASHIPHVVQIDYPDDPLIRTLLVPNARRYYVIYTPTPVYFCELRDGRYRIETPKAIYSSTNLMKVWQLAKAI